jgi:GMP synthase (glutamine-hydrolysing)
MTHLQHDTIVVLDYGSQYSQLIARRVREANVFCELFSWSTPAETILALNPKGFILSGGPNSVYDPGAPTLPAYVLQSGLPVLGICYGMQLLAHGRGGRVGSSPKREYGPATLQLNEPENPLFKDWRLEIGDWENLQSSIANPQQVWMSHGDKVEQLPPGFRPLAHTDNSPFAAAADVERRYYAVQFHPEVVHTPQGRLVLSNFVHHVCGCAADWTRLILLTSRWRRFVSRWATAVSSLALAAA